MKQLLKVPNQITQLNEFKKETKFSLVYFFKCAFFSFIFKEKDHVPWSYHPFLKVLTGSVVESFKDRPSLPLPPL